jgi:hypothetical protein
MNKKASKIATAYKQLFMTNTRKTTKCNTNRRVFYKVTLDYHSCSFYLIYSIAFLIFIEYFF